jgi:hypothetical protein
VLASKSHPTTATLAEMIRWEAHIWVKEIGRQVYLGMWEDWLPGFVTILSRARKEHPARRSVG